MTPDEMQRYSELVQQMRDAIARDFPEHAGNIHIIDPTKPLKQELKAASQAMGIPNLNARYERHNGDDDRAYAGVAISMRRGDVKNKDKPFKDDDEDLNRFYSAGDLPFAKNDMVLVLPMNPKDKASSDNIDFNFQVMTLFHEVGHALHLLDPNYKNTFTPDKDGRINNHSFYERIETFGNTFAYDVALSGGFYTDAQIDKRARDDDMNIASAGQEFYNASDELQLLRANGLPAAPKLPVIPDLRASYARATKAQAANMAEKDIVELSSINRAMPISFIFKLDQSSKGLIDDGDKKAFDAFQKVFPQSPRIQHAWDADGSKAYRPAPLEEPDLMRTVAKLWVANVAGDDENDGIEDTEAIEFLSGALKEMNRRQATGKPDKPIDIDHFARVLSMPGNKVWAEELLRGMPLSEALEMGLADIEKQGPKSPLSITTDGRGDGKNQR